MNTHQQVIRACVPLMAGGFALWGCPPANATSGDLDPAFGNGGIATIDSGIDDRPAAIARDAQGFIYLASTSDDENSNYDLAVFKVDTNGHLVDGFGSGGKVKIDVGVASTDVASAIAIGANGDIYVGGSSNAVSLGDFVIIKLDASGNLATGFGSGGKAVVDLSGNNALETLSGIAVDAEGHVFAVGTTVPPLDQSNPQIALLKLDAAGQRVASFGTNGVETVRIGGRANRSGEVVIDAAGNVFIGGGTYTSGMPDMTDTFVAKFDANGQPAAAFGTAGVALMHETYPTTGGPIVRGDDGMLYVSGGAIVASKGYFYVAKLTPDGQPAVGFGSAGRQLVDPADDSYSSFANVALAANGDLFLAGFSFYPGPNRPSAAPGAVEGGYVHIVVAQLDASGHPVSAFGSGGVTAIPIPSRNSLPAGVIADGNDHVYVGARVYYDTVVDDNYTDNLVVRLRLERPDPIFADGFDPP